MVRKKAESEWMTLWYLVQDRVEYHLRTKNIEPVLSLWSESVNKLLG